MTKRILQLPYFLFIISYSLFHTSCSVSKQINKQAQQILFSDSSIRQAHIGISIYDPAAGKYLYNHNADKYFIPASNTKLFSWYAGMKYLGDSLVGIRYQTSNDQISFLGAGDPTFLHPDFKDQPVFSFLKKFKDVCYPGENDYVQFEPWGKGWQLDDYLSDYSVERSEFPIYGNVATFLLRNDTIEVSPRFFFNYNFEWHNSILIKGEFPALRILRPFENNNFSALYDYEKYQKKEKFTIQRIPFRANFIYNDGQANLKTFHALLNDTLHKNTCIVTRVHRMPSFKNVIHSQPSDSLFKPMMHRSDNFFAEQTLLMASNEYLGFMSDRAMIDTILKSSLKDIPQQPRWVDGSGLSRYNLFTPQSFVWLLSKIKKEYDWDRIKNILPTGGEGTLRNYYVSDSAFIYAKTGTLSNNCALSGYLITRKNKILIFSVLVNNYPTGATPVRRAVEKFIKQLRNQF